MASCYSQSKIYVLLLLASSTHLYVLLGRLMHSPGYSPVHPELSRSYYPSPLAFANAASSAVSLSTLLGKLLVLFSVVLGIRSKAY